MLKRSTLFLAAAFMTAGCLPGDTASQTHSAPDESLRTGAWADYHMTRPQRSAREVIERAGQIGEVVLGDPSLPSPDLLDPSEIDAWAEAAKQDPYREGALRFEFDGHDILVRYRPASDRLTVSTFTDDSGDGTEASVDEAERQAQACLAQLEDAGVIGEGEFVDTYHYTSTQPTLVEGSGTMSIGRHSFVYHPVLNGIPLLSAEVIISVDASSSTCQRITVSGQVELERLRDAEVAFRDEALAQRLVTEAVLDSSPGSPREVHVSGEFGYYLPLSASAGVVQPTYVASYSVEVGTPEQPILGRRQLVSLPLDDLAEPELIELLGPDW